MSTVDNVEPRPSAQRRNIQRPSGRVQLLAVFRKEVLQTIRDRRIMVMLIVAPLLQTIVFGYAIDFEVDRVPTIVVDRDRSAESRHHVRRLLADGTLLRTAETTDEQEAERAFSEWKAAAAVMVPPRFGEDLLAGRSAQIQVVLDGTDPTRAMVAGGTASQYFGEVGESLARSAAKARGIAPPATVPVVAKIYYNPSLRTPPHTVPAVMGMLLLIVTTIVTAMGMTRERETGTLEQVLVTPIRPVFLLLGKMTPFLLIGLFDVFLVLAGGSLLFAVPIRGGLSVVFVATLLYLMTTLGVGLFISTISKTQQQSFLAGFLFVMPAILLSGAMSPIHAMPNWLVAATYLNPVRYYVEVMRRVLLKGASFSDVRFQLLALSALGLAIIITATLRFRKRIQ